MTKKQVIAYQDRMKRRLVSLYKAPVVEKEWKSEIGNLLYSPRLDISVGPFSTTEGKSLENTYDILMDMSRYFIELMIEFHLNNMDYKRREGDIGEIFSNMMYANRNARCFIAIEIEHTTSEKHIIGAAVNVASLGRIGLIIGWENAFRKVSRMKAYFDQVRRNKLNTFDPVNLIVLRSSQFSIALDRAIAIGLKPPPLILPPLMTEPWESPTKGS